MEEGEAPKVVEQYLDPPPNRRSSYLNSGWVGRQVEHVCLP